MANYLNTKMTSIADLIRAKTGEIGSLSVTSMISMMLRQGTILDNGLKPFLERDNSGYFPNGVVPLPAQAQSIGPYAFAHFSEATSLMQARGIRYDASAFYSCAIGTNMTNYDPTGGTFSATYDQQAAPPREPHGGDGPHVDPAVKAELLDPARYVNATPNAYLGALASTVRAVADLTDELTLQDMVDNVSATTLAGTNDLLAAVIDRTITSISVPEGVTKIGAYAFRGCANLSEVILPSTIQIDGLDGHTNDGYTGGQFLECHPTFHLTLYGNVSLYTPIAGNSTYYCTWIGYSVPDRVYTYSRVEYTYNNTGGSTTTSTEYTLTDKKAVLYPKCKSDYLSAHTLSFQDADVIAASAFRELPALRTIDLNNVSIVSEAVFAFCRNLTSIIYPTDSSVLIGDYAFQYTGFTSIIIPNTVDIIGNNVFEGCEHLQYVSMNCPNNAIIYDLMFNGCSELRSAVITGGAVDLREMVFQYNYNLVSVTLPDTISHIGYDAFYNDSNLTDFVMPANLTYLPNRVFRSCTALENLDFGNTKLKVIGQNLVESCPNITSIILPSTVTSIFSHALYAGDGLLAHPKSFRVYSAKGNVSTSIGYYSRYTAGDRTSGGTQFYAWIAVSSASPAFGMYYTTDSSNLNNDSDLYVASGNGFSRYSSGGASHVTYAVCCSSIRCEFPRSRFLNANGTFKYYDFADLRALYFPNG